jgi:Bacterial regulatory proteins, gntR family
MGSWNETAARANDTAVPRVARGHVEQLPSGSFRAVVYAGVDPLTRRPVYLKATARTEKQAQVQLGKLLDKACDGRRPESDATVARLLEEYVQIAGWDLSTRESNLGYIRRTIRPALGSMQVRKVRGPLLDTLYARLMRCGNLACTGKPLTEDRKVPDFRPDPADPRPGWQQAADRVRAAIRCGQLASGDILPSMPDLARLQGLKPGTVRHALIALAKDGLVEIRQGTTAMITGEPGPVDKPGGHHVRARLSLCRTPTRR